MDEEGEYLSTSIIKDNLSILGKHPMTNTHAYLQLKCVGKNIIDIEAIASYPLLVYLDLSDNMINDLKALENIGCLTQLRARNNKLTTCLQYCPQKCSYDNNWSEGGQAIGSQLTLADVSHNDIHTIDSLAHHPFLETLLLQYNKIMCISGLQGLKYLKVLNLSNNMLTSISGLDYLPIQELDLSHNMLQSITGLSSLPHLSALNISHNQISSLAPIAKLSQLSELDASYNMIHDVMEINHLKELQWMKTLILADNPCVLMIHYRYDVIFRLGRLLRLDATIISASERVQALNHYDAEGGDVIRRKDILTSLLPDISMHHITIGSHA